MFGTVARRAFITFTAAAVVAAAVAAPAFAASKPKERSYILATATTGGTYYPVGVALATLTKVKLQPKKKVSLSAISSAGSGENIRLLRENEAQFAIVQGIFGKWAFDGSGRLAQSGPQKHLRSVSMLWQNVEHFVVLDKYAKTGTVDDLQGLKGKKFVIGKRNSGTEGSGRHLLGGLGMDVDPFFDVVYMGYFPSVEALQNGNVEGINIPGGPPVGGVTQAFAKFGDKIRVLDFTDEQMERANAGANLWTRYVIAPNTYPGQAKPIKTIAQPNFLAVREDVDADAVYMIVKAIYENLPFLQNIHKATNAMALEKAIAGLPAPLHPGALKYYQEKGMKIPAHLIAK